MANLVLSGDTSGTVTLSAPAVSGSTTLTLPTTSSTLATLAAQTFTGTQTMTTLTSPAATALTLQSAGTTAITATTAQNVGIGTASPANKLHVSDTTTGTVKTRTEASTGYVDVGMGGNSGVFDTTGSDGVRIRMSGNDKVSIDGSTLALPGLQGIKFQATQSASSDANTLDDYEEGTWTPTDQSGASLSLTVASNPSYTKIGRMVTVMASITYPSTANGSNMLLGGLPFTSASGANGGDPGGFLRYSNYGSGLLTEVVTSATTFTCWTFAPTKLTNANASTKRFDFVMTYFV